MTSKPSKLQRPEIHFDAILALVGVLLGFLFIVVIYLLEFPQEVLTTWGLPMVAFLAVCYGVGLSIIGFILRFEINFYLANKLTDLEPNEILQEKFLELQRNLKRDLRRTVQMLLYFVFSFGLFLINLAGFAVAKIFIAFFIILQNVIIQLWGHLGLGAITFLVMLVYQFILIIPFGRFQGTLWESFRKIDDMTV